MSGAAAGPRRCAAGCGEPLTVYQLDEDGRRWHRGCRPGGAEPAKPARVYYPELGAYVADVAVTGGLL